MSFSIYYSAKREHKLTFEEKQKINILIEEYNSSKKNPKWVSFYVNNPENNTEPKIIFEGDTQLPGNIRGAWDAIQHWGSLLSKIRIVIPDAEWHVSVEDHQFTWDDKTLKYDLTK